MGNLVLNGSTSGAITISPPLIAGTNTLTLPAVTDTVTCNAAAQTLTNKTLTSPTINTPTMGGSVLTATGLVATTSGTTITLATGIPSWARQVSIVWNGVGTGSGSNFLIQLGYGGTPTYVTSGYNTVCAGYIVAQFTTAFGLGHDTAAHTYFGVYQLFETDTSTNTWAGSGAFGIKTTTANIMNGGGSIALGASNTLTAIRLTTVSGDTFNAGSINVFYG